MKRETDRGAFRIIFGDLKESVRFIAKSQKVIGKVTVIIAFVNLFISSLLIIGLPVLCTQVLEFRGADPNQMYGYLSGIMAFGGIAGNFCRCPWQQYKMGIPGSSFWGWPCSCSLWAESCLPRYRIWVNIWYWQQAHF